MSATLITIITNDRGEFPNHAYDREPEPGSVVLTEGEHGTAWQRHFVGKRLWHSTTGMTREWGQLIARRNVVLVYDAAPREEGQR